MRKQAVLYLRSSKDRASVSLAAQRRELMALAQTKGLIVSAEYADAVESGKDTDRAGFQALLRDLKAKGRTWVAILKEIDGALARLLALIEQTDTPAPILRRIEARESERAELSIRLERLEEVTRQAKALAAVKEADAQRLLAALVEDMALLDRDHLKDFLRGLVEALILDPENRTGSIRYRIAASGVKVASPRGLVPNPSLSGSMPFQAPRNRRTA